jgi:hypothetical protein
MAGSGARCIAGRSGLGLVKMALADGFRRLIGWGAQVAEVGPEANDAAMLMAAGAS